MSNGFDVPPDVPAVETPDVKQRGQLIGSGVKAAGVAEYTWGALWASIVDGLKAAMTLLASAFDEVLSILVPFLTASQGTNTQGFYDLVASLLNDLLGVEVAGSDLSAAADNRGIIGGMQQVGDDFYNVLINEFLGNQPDAGPGGGIGGLPGTPGTPIPPEQGIAGAKAFLGFIISFAVRQGNVAVLTDALSYHLLGQMREYGELMAKNLGLGRLSRRVLQPIVQTLVTTPLQQALNMQYRPHQLSERQIASAFIRSNIDLSDFKQRLALQGFSDTDAQLLISDTFTRLNFEEIYILHENGFIDDGDFKQRVTDLGYNSGDFGLLIAAKNLETVQRAEREYVKTAEADLHNDLISLQTFEGDVDSTTLPKVEKEALKRNGANRVLRAHKILSLGFMKRAFLDGQVTIDEVLQHVAALGYSQDDADIIEVELLLQLAEHKAAAAAKAKKVASKTAKATPPTTPPAA